MFVFRTVQSSQLAKIIWDMDVIWKMTLYILKELHDSLFKTFLWQFKWCGTKEDGEKKSLDDDF